VGGSDHLRRLDAMPDAIDAADSGSDLDPEERRLMLERALEQIRCEFSERLWQQFHKSAVLGVPAPDVAREFGTTAAAVRMGNSRIKKRLREVLGELWE
jgi:hypothetical protein